MRRTDGVRVYPLGSVDCAHGRLPVPVPVVVELLRGRPIVRTDAPGEITTPTGAALLVELTEIGDAPVAPLVRSGAGVGTRDHGGWPSRVLLSLLNLSCVAS